MQKTNSFMASHRPHTTRKAKGNNLILDMSKKGNWASVLKVTKFPTHFGMPIGLMKVTAKLIL